MCARAALHCTAIRLPPGLWAYVGDGRACVAPGAGSRNGVRAPPALFEQRPRPGASTACRWQEGAHFVPAAQLLAGQGSIAGRPASGGVSLPRACSAQLLHALPHWHTNGKHPKTTFPCSLHSAKRLLRSGCLRDLCMKRGRHVIILTPMLACPACPMGQPCSTSPAKHAFEQQQQTAPAAAASWGPLD